jgi:hypothetical protein
LRLIGPFFRFRTPRSKANRINTMALKRPQRHRDISNDMAAVMSLY